MVDVAMFIISGSAIAASIFSQIMINRCLDEIAESHKAGKNKYTINSILKA